MMFVMKVTKMQEISSKVVLQSIMLSRSQVKPRIRVEKVLPVYSPPAVQTQTVPRQVFLV